MEGIDYLRGFRRGWWLIVVVLIAGGAGGYLYYRQATPQYQSYLRLVVAIKGQSTDEVSAQALAEAQAQALAEVASTPPGIAAAARKAGYPGASPMVDANALTTQPFVNITVTDTDPRRAQAIAQAFATTVTPTKERLEGRNSAPFVVTRLGDATLPSSPFSPSRRRDLGLGLAIGLVLGLALALLRESLDRTVRDSEQLQRVTGLPLLGTVPRDLPKIQLPTRSHPRSPRSEAYRQIRTALTNASETRPLIVAVTSAGTGDGKTSVATNVAAALSRAGNRVAIVDADLRRPRVSDFFGISREPGLSEVLSGTIELRDALRIEEDGRLAVLPAGAIPANPSEALGSAAMEQVLAELANDWEFVLLDTPPVLPVTDAVVLAPKVSGVVLVARLSRITRGRVAQAVALLDRVHPTVFGVVANQADRSGERSYVYGYSYTERRGRGTTVEAGPMISVESGSDAAPDRTTAAPLASTQPPQFEPPAPSDRGVPGAAKRDLGNDDGGATGRRTQSRPRGR